MPHFLCMFSICSVLLCIRLLLTITHKATVKTIECCVCVSPERSPKGRISGSRGLNITDLQPDILECEVKWALESITTNKASGCDRIPVERFQILTDDAVKVLHSICLQIWKTQQWPQDAEPRPRGCSGLGEPRPALPSF